jgi:hypothetical protein
MIPALLLSAMISAPAMAEYPDSYSMAQAATSNKAPVQASYKKLSNDLNKIEINGFKFELKACQRDGENVICNLQLTNITDNDQSISLFPDCSQVTTDSGEFGAYSAQIGQGSSATLNAGISRQGFITFRSIAPNVDKLETLEVAYNTTDGEGTIKFSNIVIK